MNPCMDAYTITETANKLRVSPRTIYRLIEVGELGHTRVGTKIRVTEQDIDAYLALHHTPGRVHNLPHGVEVEFVPAPRPRVKTA